MKRWWLYTAIVVVLFPAFGVASKEGLTIHSFQISGENTYDEFVSISNDTPVPLDITNYSISRKTKSGTSWNTLYKFTAGTIGPHQIITISHEKYTGVRDFVYSTTSYSLTADNSVAIIAPDKTIIDLVGYGEASSYEGSLLPEPSVGEVYTRTQETDNNYDDFVSSVKAVVLDPNADKLLITELMPAPDEGKEWIEIYNPTSLLVSLNGLKLCDAMGSIHCYYFTHNDYLNPFEYKIYSQEVTKITLNNTGDWVELRDGDDNLITDSGGDYGDADSGIALALFGSEFKWTKVPTPEKENIFIDTIELETMVAKKPKSTSKKVKKTVVKNSSSGVTAEEESPGVAGVSIESPNDSGGKDAVTSVRGNNTLLGYSLIIMAVTILLGYNLWDKRHEIRNLYHKISRRNH